jgi:hypothetical protein
LKRSDSDNLDVLNGKKKVHLITNNNNEKAENSLALSQNNDSISIKETIETSTNYAIQESKKMQYSSSSDIFQHQNDNLLHIHKHLLELMMMKHSLNFSLLTKLPPKYCLYLMIAAACFSEKPRFSQSF